MAALSTSSFTRLRRAMTNQQSRMAKNELLSINEYDMKGKICFVTGGNGGIGKTTCQKLAQMGATVIMGCRRPEAAAKACDEIKRNVEGDAKISSVTIDLSDLESVRACCVELATGLNGDQLDCVDLNAGISPTKNVKTKQGHELAFGVNVLGNFTLIQEMQKQNLLKPMCRVVIVTGDIYVLASDCTPDYKYSSSIWGNIAYARSKLGVMWFGFKLAELNKDKLEVVLVHPGVIDTGLIGAEGLWLKRKLYIDAETGSNTSIYCMCSPQIENGSYYLNTEGKATLNPKDKALDQQKMEAFWDQLQQLSSAS